MQIIASLENSYVPQLRQSTVFHQRNVSRRRLFCGVQSTSYFLLNSAGVFPSRHPDRVTENSPLVFLLELFFLSTRLHHFSKTARKDRPNFSLSLMSFQSVVVRLLRCYEWQAIWQMWTQAGDHFSSLLHESQCSVAFWEWVSHFIGLAKAARSPDFNSKILCSWLTLPRVLLTKGSLMQWVAMAPSSDSCSWCWGYKHDQHLPVLWFRGSAPPKED